MIGDGLIERNLRGSNLRLDTADLGFVGQHQQIGVAHGEHNQIARIFRRQLRGGKVVARGKIVAQRLHIHERPGHVGAHIDIAERPDDLGKARNAQALGGQIGLRLRFLGR